MTVARTRFIASALHVKIYEEHELFHEFILEHELSELNELSEFRADFLTLCLFDSLTSK